MDKAFDPFEYELLTVREYEVRFGKSVDKDNKPSNRPSARCPVCLGSVYIKGIGGKREIYAHTPSDAKCPIKDSGAEKYKILSPVAYDDDIAKRLRESFFLHWKLHWLQFMKYVNYVDVRSFVALIKYADAQQLWRYRGLQEFEVTFILLVLMDFKPVKDFKTKKFLRPEWVSFWFPATVRRLDDFWNLQPARRVIIKASYSTSVKAKRPHPRDIMGELDVVTINNQYLVGRDSNAATVADFVTSEMTKAFGNELAIVAAQQQIAAAQR